GLGAGDAGGRGDAGDAGDAGGRRACHPSARDATRGGAVTTVEARNLRPLTATLIARYAERFNAAFADGEHAVTSPLGAWLLLALVAPSADGDRKARLEEVLGTTAEDAFARATALLE